MTCALITEFDDFIVALQRARELLANETFREREPEKYERLKTQTPLCEEHLHSLQRIERRVSESFVEFDIALKHTETDWQNFISVLEDVTFSKFNPPTLRYSSSSSNWKSAWARGGLGVTLPNP